MNFSQIIIAILINVWAFRLGTYLFQRILKRKSDERFNEIRPNKWSFLKFWVLQGFAVWIILLPALFFFYNEVQSLFYPGIIIWTVGFLFESIADYQKSRFKKTAKSKEAFISSGLFKYARYPNYFGEIACWAGIYLIVLPGLDIYQMTISILSPLFIFILLRYFTGIPPLEKISNERRKNNPAFIIYRDKTNLLFPWFPGK
jgi:steroid 5-alpha reductase family enzyme